jgi:hypothetical protein
LREATTRCRNATRQRRISEAQCAAKNALEALHGLEDGRRKRGEWTYASWTAEEIEEWNGLMGIRNAAHHLSVRAVVLVGGSDHVSSDEDLQWTTDTLAIDSNVQAAAYASRLAGKPVLRTLDQAASRITPTLGA